MQKNNFFTTLLRALDPKLNKEIETPRPLLLAIRIIEHLFKIIGYFLLLCLVVGLTYSACPDNIFFSLFPVFTASVFFFYVAITTVGIPTFILIDKIENTLFRRIISYIVLISIFIFVYYSVLESPIFDALLIYVGKLFPMAFECKTGPITL